MHALKELYLSIFVLFYRIGSGLWPPAMNADAHKGVAGISVVEGLLALSLADWLAVVARHRLDVSPLVVGAAFFALFFVNYFFLVARKSGVAFEKKFGSFETRKRIALLLGAIGIAIAAVIMFYFSVSDYQRTFNIN